MSPPRPHLPAPKPAPAASRPPGASDVPGPTRARAVVLGAGPQALGPVSPEQPGSFPDAVSLAVLSACLLLAAHLVHAQAAASVSQGGRRQQDGRSIKV